uniref:Uncharacterized protein n=1 Tax=Timema cristinae TaxID=61476 RepID=A0A7R9H7F0_TIMCR|nr:unnamed protein product [Timema cristinae]
MWHLLVLSLSELEEEVVEEEDSRGDEGTEDYSHEEDTFTHYFTSTTPSPPPPPPPPPPVIKTVTANFSITTENRSQPEMIPPVTRKPFVPTALSPQENKRPYSPTSHSYFNQGQPQVNVQKPGESGVLSGGYRPPVTSTAVPGGSEHAKHQHRTQQILDLHKQGDKRQFVPTTQSPSHFFGVNNNPSGFSITTTHATNSAPFPSVQPYPEVVDYHRTFAVSPGFINQQLSHPVQTPTKSSIFVIQDDGHLHGDRQSPIVRAAQRLRSTIASHGGEFPSHHSLQLSHSPLTFHFNSHQPGHQLFTTPALAIVSTTSSTSKSLNGKGFQERPVAPPPIINRSESYSFISDARPAVSINLTAPGPTSPQLFLETTAPGVYDEYQEHDVHTDPFFRDVPRIGKSNPTSTIVRRTTTTRRKRNTNGSSQAPTESQFKLEKSSWGLKNIVKKSHNKVTKISSEKTHKKKHKGPPSVPATSFGLSVKVAETESSKESLGLEVTGLLHRMNGPKADHSDSRHPLSGKTSLRPNFLNTKRITDTPRTKHEPLINDRSLSEPIGLGSEEIDTEGDSARDYDDGNKEGTTHRRGITVSQSSRGRYTGGSDKNSIQTYGVVKSRKTYSSDKPHRGGLEVSLLGGNSSEIKQVAINKTKPYTLRGQVRQNKPTDDKNITYKYSTSIIIEVPSISDDSKRNGSHKRQKRQLSEVTKGVQPPRPNFSCEDKTPGGYYADLGFELSDLPHMFSRETRQRYSRGRTRLKMTVTSRFESRLQDNKFWCGPGTTFDQHSLTCQAAGLVSCSSSSSQTIKYLEDVPSDSFFKDVPRVGRNKTRPATNRRGSTRTKRDASSQIPAESQSLGPVEWSDRVETMEVGVEVRVSKKPRKKKYKITPTIPISYFETSDVPKADHSDSRHPLSGKTSLRPNFLNTKRITDTPRTKHELLINDRSLSEPIGLGSEEIDIEGDSARDYDDGNKEGTTHRRSITISRSSRGRHTGGSDKNSIQKSGVGKSRKTYSSDKPHRGGLEVSLLGGNSSEIKQVAINKTKPYKLQGQVHQNKPTDDKNMTYKYSTSITIEVPSISDDSKRNGSHTRQKRQLSEALAGFQTPSTSFSCKGKIPGGYYADLGSNCQIFHICSQGRHGSSVRLATLVPRIVSRNCLLLVILDGHDQSPRVIRGQVYMHDMCGNLISRCHDILKSQLSLSEQMLKDNMFWCGPGTSFNQISLTCQTSELVDCSLAPTFYYLNDHFLDDLSTIH